MSYAFPPLQPPSRPPAAPDFAAAVRAPLPSDTISGAAPGGGSTGAGPLFGLSVALRLRLPRRSAQPAARRSPLRAGGARASRAGAARCYELHASAARALAARVGRGPEAPEARGARNRRGVPRREAPHKSPRRQIWNSLLVQWLEQSVLRRAFNFLSIFFFISR